MFPTLVALDHAVRDVAAFVQQRQGPSVTTTLTLTPTVAPALVARLLNGIEEAFAPDPMVNAAAFFEGVAMPLLHRLPRRHKTHFPMEETLRGQHPDAAHAFRCWVVHSLNTVDALYEAAALLLVGLIVRDTAATAVGQQSTVVGASTGSAEEKVEEDASQFRTERLQRLQECLGPHATLLNAGYVTQLLLLLPKMWHPLHQGGGAAVDGRGMMVQYCLSLAEALPLFREAPRPVHVERLRLHQRRRKRRCVSSAAPAPAPAPAAAAAGLMSEGYSSQSTRRAASTIRVSGSKSAEEHEASDAVLPLSSCLKDIMRPQAGSEGHAGVDRPQRRCARGSRRNCHWDGKEVGEYCYVADAATQTPLRDAHGNCHEVKAGDHDDIENDNAAATTTPQSKPPLLECVRTKCDKLYSQSVGTNTSHPSSFMTFVEMLDAQEQLERARKTLQRKEESLQLRECGLVELEDDYKEKLDMLIHVLHGARELYNDLVMGPMGRGGGATCEAGNLTATTVQFRLLNLVEVIYGTPGGEAGDEASVAAVENKRTISSEPIPDTPASRAAAKMVIVQHHERRRKQLLEERCRLACTAPAEAPAEAAEAPTPLSHALAEVPRPLQLRQQAYLCPGCGTVLGESTSFFFRQCRPRRCHYCTQIYCHECHVNQKAILPFLVLTSWNFTPRNVCKRDYGWLQQNWGEPWYTIGDRETQVEQRRCCRVVALRDSVRLAKVLRHWLLLCARMVRGCPGPFPEKVVASLQSYHSETDVMYSLSDLSGIRYSEEAGVAARVLRCEPTSLVATTVGSVVSAVSSSSVALGRFVAARSSARSNGGVAEVVATATKRHDDSAPCVNGGAAHVSTASVASDVSVGHSFSTFVSTATSREGEKQDFLDYLVAQIRVLEQHLHRDCPICVARATTVCELCGARDARARLPLVDAEVFGVRLLEKTGPLVEEDTQLVRLACVAMQLVRGDGAAENVVVACKRCSTRYHKACLGRSHCPHCS
ncbi:putative run domain Beclin-1 interacting and cystein-rich containing protein-like [Trypanosoma rangeli]|uniref:Putative run domain Beclin-1 interacting and cystein-rich containing protein-like n=1 Tax=Trypanosoma rangeli TaxID=5698 RepID=A0A422NNY3_TRYRA|nr:putative run domain Beclin-1 interacting and cystein-rich containing protein-like [Trypanosoma rangeli]RNF07089.1 putative run domain Beclin-1 interacting and cystein-rich containing protein-like [Trypanosoma rangeli]|eukprot:RNF07089.1 putative run domain Beclin-1 interacting and cystein-rich containing protein-like [Trypanosoma rangeli]